jgi:dipeptidyl aminopeptidase/acylaminoacyl peptidase
MGLSEEFDDWKYGLISNCCGYTVTKETLMDESQQEALKRVSPCSHVSADCVPTAVFYGRYDELIPSTHTEDFVDLLKKFGVENEVLCYENSGHTLDKDPEVAEQSRNIITAYAERYL